MTEWVCWCGQPSLYRAKGQCFCDNHWNYGEPMIQESRKKPLEKLTDKERELLINMGMMWELYPEANEFGRKE